MTMDCFYDISSGALLIILILITVSLAISGLVLFDMLVSDEWREEFENDHTNIYISIISFTIGIVIAFVISDEWQRYYQAETNILSEANNLYLLYDILIGMNNTQQHQDTLLSYIQYIIEREFPALESSILLEEGDRLVSEFRRRLYDYNKVNDKDGNFHDKSIDIFNEIVALRNFRLNSAFTSLPPELWSVILIGLSVIIIMLWFMVGAVSYRIVMTIFVSIVFASLIFLIIALDCSFKGDFGLDSTAFQNILEQINKI